MTAPVPESAVKWVEDVLGRLGMVTWDRFTVAEDSDIGTFLTVYGWIDRDGDYKDFCVVRFFPDTDENLISYTTSSDEFTEEIHRRIFGEDAADGHNDCRRVEDRFDVENVVTLGTDTELSTFVGGDQA